MKKIDFYIEFLIKKPMEFKICKEIESIQESNNHPCDYIAMHLYGLGKYTTDISISMLIKQKRFF
tara:strand:+ start:7505 stop:7699 length:195 start_codon:yes stop_codon:yes gene_type:complete